MGTSETKYKQLLYVTECLSHGLDSSQMRSTLGEALLKLLDADYYASYIWNSAGSRFGKGVSINMDKKKLNEYEQYYQFHDPITYKLQKRKRATCVNEVIDQKELERTEFYNDFLSHDGLHSGVNLYAYDCSNNNIGDIRIWRNKKRQAFDRTSVDLLQRISPHFTNSLRNMHRCSETNSEETSQDTSIINASWDLALIAKEFSFTGREAEIVRELLRGKKDEDIANQLCIACCTLRTHVQHIYAKTSVHNRTSLSHKVLNKLTGFK